VLLVGSVTMFAAHARDFIDGPAFRVKLVLHATAAVT
jgi:hypothetical protein